MRFFRQWLTAVLIASMLAGASLASPGQQRPWILVDTGALTLTVLSSDDHVLARFHNISIGSGGAADIHRRGDETTPRGVFRIAWIDRRHRYGTFYGLDYPSAAIARRAHAAGIISQAEAEAILAASRQDRMPPQGTALGGRLGIHGIGRGDPRIHAAFNWTNGCVALTNAEIRQLGQWARVGTRVVIR